MREGRGGKERGREKTPLLSHLFVHYLSPSPFPSLPSFSLRDKYVYVPLLVFLPLFNLPSPMKGTLIPHFLCLPPVSPSVFPSSPAPVPPLFPLYYAPSNPLSHPPSFLLSLLPSSSVSPLLPHFTYPVIPPSSFYFFASLPVPFFSLLRHSFPFFPFFSFHPLTVLLFILTFSSPFPFSSSLFLLPFPYSVCFLSSSLPTNVPFIALYIFHLFPLFPSLYQFFPSPPFIPFYHPSTLSL